MILLEIAAPLENGSNNVLTSIKLMFNWAIPILSIILLYITPMMLKVSVWPTKRLLWPSSNFV